MEDIFYKRVRESAGEKREGERKEGKKGRREEVNKKSVTLLDMDGGQK